MANDPRDAAHPIPQFPAGFLWGVSTSAHQIEGAADERGPSVWDAFTAEPGRVKDGSTAAVACDHFHRYPEDVALLKGLGVDAYRFSISWPRALFDNGRGLDFYDRLVDELCAAGVRPVPTLFHWDLPADLDWLERDTASRFAEYVSVVADRLGDRVKKWITINEPAEHTLLGHALGTHAPGRQLLFDALPAAHHQLLGHGLAVQALRAAGATDIGIANSHGPTWPASQQPADQEAAAFYDVLLNRLFAEPVLLGEYPEGLGELMPGGDVQADLKVISEPLDWYGINYYAPTKVGAPQGTEIEFGGITMPAELPFSVRQIEGVPVTDFGWPVVPEGLTELLTTFHERYGDRLPPVVITENGCSYDGVDDQARIAYLDGHLRALHQASVAGVDVRGYFVWSLLDNFEWAEGYEQRFGLVHVDYATQTRTPKSSYAWLRDVLRGQRAQGSQARG
ncbi:beta-glucosidase [Streptomyces sp. yr375]|uniref:GH1 family beta-glucosidase n=1 Tax=Streptomyces sp. yr375 TaxID=1761906 RepID=UPI0008BC18C0|nr:GH1 family beta-glucosidase [Streptomyces sp. yr375]SER79831.1 beta-glucosidase [Streptomyces sp. yr375]